MEALILRPNPGDVAAVPVRQRELVVGVSQRDDLKGQVRKALLEQGCLTSIHERTEVIELWDTHSSKSRLTRDNPFLDPRTLECLDEHGRIRNPGSGTGRYTTSTAIFQQSLLATRHGVQVGPRFDQEVERLDMAMLGRQHHGRGTVHLLRFEGRPFAQKFLDLSTLPKIAAEISASALEFAMDALVFHRTWNSQNAGRWTDDYEDVGRRNGPGDSCATG